MEALLRELWRCHRSIAADWLPIDSCFPACEDLPRALAQPEGQASGPLRLLRAYAQVMRKSGLSAQVRMLRPGRPYWSQGRSWARRPPVSACIIGGSYFVASRFTAVPVAPQ
jgi:hypothetical protein